MVKTMREFQYEITKHIGTVSTSDDGRLALEVNEISYNGAPAKVDIRTWNKENDKMYKGITLTHDDASALGRMLLGVNG